MLADFLDSHERHWDDAETLFNAQRWANADHLYGMTAECGLKRLMVAFGMHVNPVSGSPASQLDRAHADQVSARFESYRSGHLQGAGYALLSPDPFANWHVSQRYANQTNFNQALVTAHQAGAQAICGLIKQALVQGLI